MTKIQKYRVTVVSTGPGEPIQREHVISAELPVLAVGEAVRLNMGMGGLGDVRVLSVVEERGASELVELAPNGEPIDRTTAWRGNPTSPERAWHRPIPADVAAAKSAGLAFLSALGAVEDVGYARQLLGLLVADAVAIQMGRLGRHMDHGDGLKQTLEELTEDLVSVIAEDDDLEHHRCADF